MGLMTQAGKRVAAAAAPWLEAVAPFWPLIWRAAVAAGLVWVGWHYGGRDAEAELERFKQLQAQATSVAVANLRADVAERDLKLTKQEADHVRDLDDLKARQAATPARVVRVCPDPGPRPVPGVPAAAGGLPPDGGGAGELRPGAGFDLGPGLKRLVDRADRLRVKCIAQEERADQLAEMKPGAVPSR
jgi:hypothetical protein